MKRLLLPLLSIFIVSIGFGQVTTDPDPAIANQSLTITVDVSGTDLEGYADDVWIWTWLDNASGDVDAPTNVNPATDDQSGALMTRSSSDGDIYTITFTPTEFFDKPATDIDQIGLLLKGRDWSDGKTPDYLIEGVISGVYEVEFTSPSFFPLLVDPGEAISINAEASEASSIALIIDGVTVKTVTDATQVSYNEIAAASGQHFVEVVANNGTDEATDNFSYTIRTATVEQPRPAGIVDGINYDPDASKVTLSLWAPMKSSVYVVGDFNGWTADPDYQMKKDGEHFWLEVSGLIPGQEYAYQYLVDESIWIADPYADKILSPDDRWIPDTTYPNLKELPDGAYHNEWYQNSAAVVQTDQTHYQWVNTDFQKPDKSSLVIYELLVRDFLGEEHMNYQSLIDTLGYLENLGVNAIELMPIMEFAGNDSWGYNPTFMFAVDKAYGTKTDLKEFIDAAHGKGMAVILDMVMNQNDIPSPYAQMYFDFDQFRPTANNPWFNVEATHPYSVFFDINHESAYTQTWLDSINYYWIHEFHFDGYRFDLSKGFTQKYSGSNVDLWGQKDNSRIDILKRMANAIWSHTPDAYVILEHFANNDEETILASSGMMLWGNSNYDYGEANMGYGDSKSIGWGYYKDRNWTQSNLITYMESHDEERQMYKMITDGTASFNYNITKTSTALQRLKLSAAFFFTIPGPKMFWQWGEYGYDVSIEENGRTGRKPTHWEYLDDLGHRNVLETYKALIKLRNTYDVFTTGNFSWQPDGLYKTIHIANNDTSVAIIGNFDIGSTEMDPEFQHTGTWYDFFSGEEVNVTDVNATIHLGAGEFRIYTDQKLFAPEKDIITGLSAKDTFSETSLYPNPASNLIHVNVSKELNYSLSSWYVTDTYGKRILEGTFEGGKNSIDVGNLSQGIYTLILGDNDEFTPVKFIKE